MQKPQVFSIIWEETTDNFNDAHAKFLFDYVVSRNYKNLPYYFDYVAYKEGTDILEESQQYRLCIDLLDNGKEVYINDGDLVIGRIKNDLYEKYYDRVKFEPPTEEVYKIESNGSSLDKTNQPLN